jgi:molybdopterin-guanine dinucleotide biosynthesis protein MobB
MIPLISIVGKTGIGKTTLLEKLIREFKTRGYLVAVIKHHAHATPLDTPGKDSWRLAEAGAHPVIVASPIEVARFERVAREPTLAEIAAGIQNVDLILTEGFKREVAPKIEVVRAAFGTELIAPPDDLIAVVSDRPIKLTVPCFDFDDAKGIAAFMVERLHLDAEGGGLGGSRNLC